MTAIATPLPVKAAKHEDVCPSCWNPVNWCESFDKFGHDDGDDCVHTTRVAAALQQAGYHVEYDTETHHNPLITVVGQKMSDGSVRIAYSDGMPEGISVGYSDPREVLPAEVVEFLDETFGKGEFFGG